MRSRKCLAVIVAGVAFIATACRPDTGAMSDQRSVVSAYIRFSGVDAHYPGAVGLDILLGDNYNPCHQQADGSGPYNDSAYAACMDSFGGATSYFRHADYTPGQSNFVGQMAWWNESPNFCNGQPWCPPQPATVPTGWANKATGWALEFYPSNGLEGGVRLDGALNEIQGASAVSPDLGTVRLPRNGDPATTYLWGSIPGETRFQAFTVSAFQKPPFNLTTTNGYPEGGFGSVENNGSFYSTHTLPHGSYHIVVSNNITGESYGVNRALGSNFGGDNLDVIPGAPCFGLVEAYVPFTDQRVC